MAMKFRCFTLTVLLCITCIVCTTHAQLSDEERNQILEIHNKLRNDLAAGNVDSLPPATNMKTLKWDPKLERIAQSHSDQCLFQHHMTEGVGENIAMVADSKGPSRSEIPGMVKGWWDEYKQYQYSEQFVFGMSTGHFTQMAWANTDRLGCGLTEGCSYQGFKMMLLFCEYAPAGNMEGDLIYKRGNGQENNNQDNNDSYDRDQYDNNRIINSYSNKRRMDQNDDNRAVNPYDNNRRINPYDKNRRMNQNDNDRRVNPYDNNRRINPYDESRRMNQNVNNRRDDNSGSPNNSNNDLSKKIKEYVERLRKVINISKQLILRLYQTIQQNFA